ncbi:MAG: hypothetical protein P8J88_10430, partial [Phycisphaerales bacterium]|nr:hypothetical protein [Phycisphaerales bacterium]
ARDESGGERGRVAMARLEAGDFFHVCHVIDLFLTMSRASNGLKQRTSVCRINRKRLANTASIQKIDLPNFESRCDDPKKPNDDSPSGWNALRLRAGRRWNELEHTPSMRRPSDPRRLRGDHRIDRRRESDPIDAPSPPAHVW